MEKISDFSWFTDTDSCQVDACVTG